MPKPLNPKDRLHLQILVQNHFNGPVPPIHVLDFLEAKGWLRNPDNQTATNTKPTSRTLPGNPMMDKLVEAGTMASDQAMATLALAFEQRTANLIAVTTLRLSAALAGATIDAETDALYNTRLGLTEES